MLCKVVTFGVKRGVVSRGHRALLRARDVPAGVPSQGAPSRARCQEVTLAGSRAPLRARDAHEALSKVRGLAGRPFARVMCMRFALAAYVKKILCVHREGAAIRAEAKKKPPEKKK